MRKLYLAAVATTLLAFASGCSTLLEKRDAVRSYGPVNFAMSQQSTAQIDYLHQVLGKNKAISEGAYDPNSDPEPVQLTPQEQGAVLNGLDLMDGRRDRSISGTSVGKMVMDAENGLLDGVMRSQAEGTGPVSDVLKASQRLEKR